jgi:O-phospho-L-seryl-tRNASec:L-selenocysteinyl-tRNA synthase
MNHRALPKEPLDELTIKQFMDRIALMDSNNFTGNCGVGEREGRVFSRIVREKNFSLGHGIGRSGDVNALQPKAIGSSLVVQLSRAMTLNLLSKIVGISSVNDAIILPFATGMALTMALLTLKSEADKLTSSNKEYVIFPRIDQKTCLKSIYTANLKPLVVELKRNGD